MFYNMFYTAKITFNGKRRQTISYNFLGKLHSVRIKQDLFFSFFHFKKIKTKDIRQQANIEFKNLTGIHGGSPIARTAYHTDQNINPK